MRYRAARMARYAFDDPMAGRSPRCGGGWKSLFWFAVAMAGLGFAGYVYLVPYQKMQHAVGRIRAELRAADAAEAAIAERDKLKADLEQVHERRQGEGGGRGEAQGDGRRAGAGAQAGLEELGATVAADGAELVGQLPGREADRQERHRRVGRRVGGDQDPGRRRQEGGRARSGFARARRRRRRPRSCEPVPHRRRDERRARRAHACRRSRTRGCRPRGSTIVGQADEAGAARRAARRPPPRAARSRRAGGRARVTGSGRALARALDATAVARALVGLVGLSRRWRRGAPRAPTTSPSTCARSGRATRCAASPPTAATSCCRGGG